MRRFSVAAILVFIMIAPAGASGVMPDEIIREAVDLLTEGLDGRREELIADKDALYEFIDGILLPRFERRFAAMAVLGKHWKQASQEQQSRFIEAFYTTLVQRYAEGILEFETDRIEILPFKGDVSKRYTTVKTNVRLDDGTRVPVHYDLVKSSDSWRMFNVKIEGVSYVKNYRTELDSEIRSSSLAAVIERLETEAGIVASE